MNKKNKSGVTGVLQRPDCSIKDWMAFKHVYGVKLSTHNGTKMRATISRETMEYVIARLNAAGLLHNPRTHKVVPK